MLSARSGPTITQLRSTERTNIGKCEGEVGKAAVSCGAHLFLRLLNRRDDRD